jgi:arginine-tRNA-protein transferase
MSTTHTYLVWNEQHISPQDAAAATQAYAHGYVYVRPAHMLMQQTRSVRINLEQFSDSSENRRILRKMNEAGVVMQTCRLPYADYDWTIGKLGKDFYSSKFGDGTFSANKIKSLLTEPETNNFNRVLVFSAPNESGELTRVGYVICYETETMLHYSFPFYEDGIKNLGIGMMTMAITEAKQQAQKEFVYLGSAQRPTDTYKMQFAGFEWFDGEGWSGNLGVLKELLMEIED